MSGKHLCIDASNIVIIIINISFGINLPMSSGVNGVVVITLSHKVFNSISVTLQTINTDNDKRNGDGLRVLRMNPIKRPLIKAESVNPRKIPRLPLLINAPSKSAVKSVNPAAKGPNI